MVKCTKCQTENDDGYKFCKQCGNDLLVNKEAPTQVELKALAEELNKKSSENSKKSLNTVLTEIPKKIFFTIKNSIFFRKVKNTVITSISVVLLISLVVGVLNSGYLAFRTAYDFENYDAAKSIKAWPFNSTSVKDNIEKFVISKMDDYYKDFNDKEITYDEAIKKFEIAQQFCDNGDSKNKTDSLNNSRIAFKLGEEKEGSGNIYDATLEYLKVIEEDENYKTAQEKIESSKPQIKSDAIIKMDNCANVNDFNTGLSIVSDVEKIFKNDSDINNYKIDFEARKEAHRIQELKNNQKVKVLSARAFNDGYYYIFRKGTVVLQNCSDKVLKEATVVILQFDGNGYPVDAEYSMYSDNGVDNSHRCGTGSINIQPGATWGGSYSWSIADNATKIKACVKTAEFYDGGTWTNPYYDEWLKAENKRY